MTASQELRSMLRRGAGEDRIPELAPEFIAKLASRLKDLPLFAHSYAFVRNMSHGSFTTWDFLEFAYLNELDGVCLHVNDGDATSLSSLSAGQLEQFGIRLQDFRLRMHIEISSTSPAEVDEAVRLARALNLGNIRLYARHRGRLDQVIERVYADLSEVADKANAYGLHFDYEQHEDLRASEIAEILLRINDRRINALFDYTNSWNAYEEPLDALRILAPFIRQVHLKGGKKTCEQAGWGQIGVPQGSETDELPGALMLAELAALGESEPQVVCFALENEVGYYAPPFRGPADGPNPLIAYREPSDTPMPAEADKDRLLLQERLWAQQQVRVVRDLAAELQLLASEANDQYASAISNVGHAT